MDYALYLRAILALAFVLGLMLALLWLVKRFNLVATGQPRLGKSRRVTIAESLSLDARRRVVLIRRDNVEHLVLIGASGETVIESGIAVPTAFREPA